MPIADSLLLGSVGSALGGQPGFFDGDERLEWLSAASTAGDPLVRLAAAVDFELSRAELERALNRPDRAQGRRPACDAVLMFKVLILQTLYTFSDDQTEYQLRDQLSFMRFIGLSLHEPVPDSETIWLYREQLVRAGAFDRLFAIVRSGAARARLSCYGGRLSTPRWSRRAPAGRGGEGYNQKRGHAGAVEAGTTHPHRPLWPLDAEPRQEAGASRPSVPVSSEV